MWPHASVIDHLSPQELILITWHFIHYVNPSSGLTNKMHTLIIIFLLSAPTEGKPNSETTWQVPLPHMLMCFDSLSHPGSLCLCVKRARWCRTPVSFQLSRCFTLDVYQNIRTLMKTTFFFHVGACQSMPGWILNALLWNTFLFLYVFFYIYIIFPSICKILRYKSMKQKCWGGEVGLQRIVLILFNLSVLFWNKRLVT